MSSVLGVLLQAGVVGLLIWGAYLCFAERDRRSGRDRRGPGRGGRRTGDAPRRVAPSTAIAAAAEDAAMADQRSG
ncbi:MAG TPA: hypothetical protein VHL85_08940 [Burkholderiales bacterium]|jgi:hypothetical protein|nr:hypothetical protein [Burkholderiales bacterium]